MTDSIAVRGAKRAVVFDVDGTLMDCWAGDELVRHDMWSRVPYPSGLLLLMRRAASFVRAGFQPSADVGVAVFKGLDQEAAEALASDCFYERIRERLFDRAVAMVLDAQQDDATHVLLASGSSTVIVREIGKFLGVKDVVGTDPEQEGELYTGKPARPLCFGKGKLRRVTEHLDGKGISLENTTFYTDSEIDLPLLEAVGDPVVVNPTPLLRITAKARGWKIEEWWFPSHSETDA